MTRIALDQLDALTGLLPEATPPRMVARIARWAITQAAPAPAVGVPAPVEIGTAPAAAPTPAPAAAPVRAIKGAHEWTPAERDLLSRMWADGAQLEDIVAALPGRNPRAVADMRRRLRLPGRVRRRAAQVVANGKRWTEAEDATLMRMWNDGKTATAIAAALTERSVKAVEMRKRYLSYDATSTGTTRRTPIPVPPDAAAPALQEAAPAAPVAESAPVVAEPAPRVDETRQSVVKPVARVAEQPAPVADPAPVAPIKGADALFLALTGLDDSFEPIDDQTLVERRYLGTSFPVIAEELGCDEDTAKARWRAILKCGVKNSGGIVTETGWAELRAAVARRASEG